MMNHRMIVLLPLLAVTHVNAQVKNEQGGYINVQGKQQYYIQKGEGKPAVVFATGLGVECDDFSLLQDQISKNTQTLIYDRAGIGKSEATGSERNLKNICEELNEVIEKTGISKPFILVAHSRGGLVARQFVKMYPSKVSGLVLIDPSLPLLKQKRKALRNPQEQLQFDQYYQSFYSDTTKIQATIKNEFKHLHETDTSFVKEGEFKADIPVTIIASIKISKEKYSREDNTLKAELLKSYADKFKNIKLVFTQKSGHFIHSEEPRLVCREILTMIDEVKQRRK